MSLATDMQRIDSQRAKVAQQRAQAEQRRAEAMRNAAETAAASVRTALHVAQNVLNGGEISPDMAARMDQPRYQTGCETLENMVPLPQGGITKRPGLEHLGVADGGAGVDGSFYGAARFIPFVFSASESRMLEFVSPSLEYSRLNVWLPDGTLYKRHAVTMPYSVADIAQLSYAQSADVIFLAHHQYPPAKLSRYSDDDWRYEEIDWLPHIQAPSITEAATVGTIPAGENSRTNYAYVATAIDGATGEESLPSEAVTVENAAPLSQSYYIRVTLSPVEGAGEYRVYKKKGGVYGYIGRITDIDGELSFEDRNIGADTEDTPPEARNPFDGPGNYPSVVFLHQQRLGFAASDNQPLTVWMSQAGNFESMAASIPPADDDALEATLAATQANRILWCQSDRNGLALGTEGSEWILTGTDGGAVTPSNLSFQPQTFYGSQPYLPVLRTGQGLVFVQRGGQVLREYGYNFSSDRYESGDLSLLARHILRKTPIVSWAWQAEPYSIIWCVLSDGTLAGLTYMREHDVVGWHRHSTPGGVIEDVAVIPGEDGNSQVWLHVARGKFRYVERIFPFCEGEEAKTSRHVDGVDEVSFPARCVPCMPETTLDNGSTLMRVRKLNAIKCRVINSGPFSARVGDGPLMPVPARGATFASLADWAVPLASGWRDGGRLELVFDGPDPVTLLAVLTTVEIADMSGGQH